MQMFNPLEQDHADRVGWGVHVLLASPSGPEGPIARRLAGLGGVVEVAAQLCDALAMVLDETQVAQMLVIDCDAYAGLAAAQRACGLGCSPALRVPVILISAECREQCISQNRGVPNILRAPVSAVALRVAFDAAFRDRLIVGSD